MMTQDLYGEYDHSQVADMAANLIIENQPRQFDDFELARLVALELIAMGFKPKATSQKRITTLWVEIA